MRIHLPRLILGATAAAMALGSPALPAAEDWQDAKALTRLAPVECMQTVRPLADFAAGMEGWTSGGALNGQSCKVTLSHAPTGGRNGSGALQVDYAFTGARDRVRGRRS